MSVVQLIDSSPKTTPERPYHLLTLSAKSATTLQKLAERYHSFLNNSSDVSLADICFTANTKRSHLNHRLAIITESLPQLQEQLQSFLSSKTPKGVLAGQISSQGKLNQIVFLFTGQGSQYVNMGRVLYETQPTFRRILNQCDEILQPLLNCSLLSILYPDNSDSPELHQTAYTQPALFALEYALAQLWQSWGIVPDAVMGHSVGEYVAACVAGVFSLEDGLKLIAKRASLIQSLPKNGMMAAVFASEETIAKTLKTNQLDVDIATINGNENVVISGLKESVEKVLSILESQGIKAKPLQVSHAFHSSLMEPILAPFQEVAESLTYHSPRLPLISNVTGQPFQPEEVPDAAYWCRHLRGAVRFSDGMETLYQQGYRIFIEMGPSSTLLNMGQRCLTASDGLWLSSLKRGQCDWFPLLESLGQLHVEGIEINWRMLDKDYQRRQVSLPSYPFERQRFQLELLTENPAVYSPKILEKPTVKVSDNLQLFYQWQWQCETLPTPHQFPSGDVLIFGDSKTLASSIKQAIPEENHKFFWVMPGEGFQQEGNEFIINPNSPEDYEQLMAKIKANGHSLGAVIHHWNSQQVQELDPQTLSEKTLAESAYSVLFLGQALLKHFPGKSTSLLLTTYNNYAVVESSQLLGVHQCLGATLTQIISQENPNLKTKVVDVVSSEITLEKLTQLWIQELQTEPTEEGIIAIRGQQRFVRNLAPIKSLTRQSNSIIQDNDTYLITGGTSAVAVELIKGLLAENRLNLVLTGRQPLPPKEEWVECLEKNHPERERIRTIQQLEKMGSTVIYEAVDVTDAKEMKALMERIKQRFVRLDGVIHAAGIFDHQTVKLTQKQPETIAKVFAPKVQGTLILDAITCNQPLKFFVLLSSASASKKNWGEYAGDYAAANAFLDHYAVYRSQQQSPGRSLAINFSIWQNLGIAKARGEGLVFAAKMAGLNPLETQQATRSFIEVLSSNSPVVTHVIDLIKTPSVTTVHPNSTPEPGVKIPENIQLLVEEILNQHLVSSQENIEGDRTFPELGLDSLGAVEVIKQLNQTLKINLSPTLLFEYQTPNQLIDYLEERYGSTSQTDTVEKPLKIQKQPQKFQDIAIIGMACKVPGANNLSEYWNLLKEGRSAIKEVPNSRWSAEDYFDETGEKSHTTYCKQGGFIDNPFDFDPLFFGISPREAKVMDPQQRLFLEIAWTTLQQAGYGGKHRPKDIGVFVGCGQNNYAEHFVNSQYYGALRHRLESSTWFNQLQNETRQSFVNLLEDILKPSEILSETAAGNEFNQLAARVSHCLDLTGPSLAVSTACSSSLVALHLACESLRSGQSSMSIVGGVNLNLSPTPLTLLSRVKALSPTATCYPFDARANGMVIGEGAGALLLKPLEKAIVDGDYIHAVIKGSAINNDGHSQGITAPNPQGQAAAIREAYTQFNIDPNTISYIETHGTGTLLGDPIEIEGMTQAFRSFTERRQFCGVGSVKSSIGHCLSASGIISLIKVVLSMQNDMIPPTKGFKTPNSNINFAETPFYTVGEEGIIWKQKNKPLRAGVNGFGFGGTNCHVILEQAPSLPSLASEYSPQSHLFLLTARNQQVLQTVAKQLREHLLNYPEENLSSVAFTFNNTQREFPNKTAFVVEARKQLLDYLEAIENNTKIGNIYQGRANSNRPPSLSVFLDGSSLLTPEETQVVAEHFPRFKAAYQECQTTWQKFSLTGKDSQKMFNQKAHVFAVQYALSTWLMSLELQPTSLLAEDIGILVAACLSGRLTLEDAIAALARLEGEKIVLPLNTLSPEKSIKTQWNCPLITPNAIFKNPTTLSSLQLSALVQSSNSLHPRHYQEMLAKGGICLGLGNERQPQNLEANLTWIAPNVKQQSVTRLLTLMAQLYTVGVRFNSGELFPQGRRRLPLPTYPFEHQRYRATIANQEAIEAPSTSPVNPDLLPTDQLPTLSPEQRHSSYLALAKEFKRLS
ncbi:SDR family oxidoreductase [Capilliphycus salinus ALCB114379]|uniref:SDR family oxidoreductase n=1 Tax=Capilliphycus salinus TaxID=2768948 RepID=UPI0039A62266